MKLLKKTFLSILLACTFILPAFAFRTQETSTVMAAGTGYTQASDVDYVKSGKYVANWGARDEDCVFLSTYAQSFYTGNYVYETMSQEKGGTGKSDAPSSALYSSLQKLMSSKQTYQTSYDATRSLYCYTDCIQSNYSKISSFYSGKMISGTWDGGKTWNREHTWPNSKGDASGSGENDIMMLRPASVSENSSRGNKAYGQSSGYYDPNCEGQNLRGDCARIVLYVYVRWKCTNTGSKYNPKDIFGTAGVIESLTYLLKWMEEDPVDTWEMGRNDAVQSITGTRNVFVDYPEYAWLLFGQKIPSNMTTPSGMAKGGGADSSSNSSSTNSSVPESSSVVESSSMEESSSVEESSSSVEDSSVGGEAVNVTKTTLTSANLGLTSTYNMAEKSATIDGITYAFLCMGDWGNGIQCNKKTVSSAIRNSTPFGTSIRKIVLTPTAGKGTSGKAWKASFGNTQACDELTLDVSTDANGFITINVPGDYTYFKLEHANGNAQYFSSIEIFCEESGEVTPPVDSSSVEESSSVEDSSEEISSSVEESSSIEDSSEEISSSVEESSSIEDSSEEISSSVEESSSVEDSSEEISSSVEESSSVEDSSEEISSSVEESSSVEDSSEENSCQHEYGRWFTIKKPTETEEGERERFCRLCGASQKEAIPMVTPESSSVEDSSEEISSSVEESSSVEDSSEEISSSVEESSSVEDSSEEISSSVEESSSEEENSVVEESSSEEENSVVEESSSVVESSVSEENSVVEESSSAAGNTLGVGCAASLGTSMGGVLLLLTACSFVYKRKKKE